VLFVSFLLQSWDSFVSSFTFENLIVRCLGIDLVKLKFTGDLPAWIFVSFFRFRKFAVLTLNKLSTSFGILKSFLCPSNPNIWSLILSYTSLHYYYFFSSNCVFSNRQSLSSPPFFCLNYHVIDALLCF
jgi:hypothetical protein